MRKIILEIKDFLVHLRLHYQFLILAGPFLLGGLLSPQINLNSFVIQFLSVHIFLFGGVTAYNSYWDKDEGPIGGLANPPKMKKWMLWMSWIFQIIGLKIAVISGPFFVLFYLISLLLFWFYSSPIIRWKGRPFLSFVAMGSTVICSTFLGYISYGGNIIKPGLITAALGSAMLVLAMYPVSQVYQIKADKKRGDKTFASVYGLNGVRLVFKSLYPVGILLLAFSLADIAYLLSVVAGLAGLGVALYIYSFLKTLKAEESEYKKVMKVKYVGGLTFTLIILALLFIY